MECDLIDNDQASCVRLVSSLGDGGVYACQNNEFGCQWCCTCHVLARTRTVQSGSLFRRQVCPKKLTEIFVWRY